MNKDLSIFSLSVLSMLLASNQLSADTYAESAQEQLLAEARQWVSENEGLRAEEIRFSPLDARLELQTCAQPYAMDLPFGNAKTLRVRCPSSSQQVFLRRMPNEALPKHNGPGPIQTNTGNSAQVVYGEPILRSSTQALQRPASRASLPARVVTPASSSIQFEAMVLVATANLSSGQSLKSSMFRQEVMQLNQSPAQFYSEFDGLEFLELVRPIKAGSPIRKQDLKKSTLVRKGEPVQHVISSVTGLTLSVKLEAAEDGFVGEQIRLKNPESGKTVMGRVTGRNQTKSL